MLVYNIKRTINILGIPDLIAKLKKWNSPYKAKISFLLKTGYLKLNTTHNFYSTKLAALKKYFVIRLYLNCEIGKFTVLNEKRRFFNVSVIGLVATKRTVFFRLRKSFFERKNVKLLKTSHKVYSMLCEVPIIYSLNPS